MTTAVGLTQRTELWRDCSREPDVRVQTVVQTERAGRDPAQGGKVD